MNYRTEYSVQHLHEIENNERNVSATVSRGGTSLSLDLLHRPHSANMIQVASCKRAESVSVLLFRGGSTGRDTNMTMQPHASSTQRSRKAPYRNLPRQTPRVTSDEQRLC